MNKRNILLLLAGATLMPLSAQINSPLPDGYMTRGRQMYAEQNYNGCIDQLSHLDRSSLTETEREEADWLLCKANYGASGAASQSHFVAFLSMYPYSLHRSEALLRLADCIYESNAADALKAYQHIDRNALTAPLAEELDYRLAYCYVRLADFDRAEPLFDRLQSTRRYGNAARFYKAYIAYARRDFKTAERLFSEVNTSTAPGDMADYYLSQIYYLDGNYNRALTTARALLRRNGIAPGFVAEANRVAGESLYHLGQGAEAIPYLRRYVKAVETPERPTLYILGLSEYNGGDYDAAVTSLRPVTEGDDAMAQSAYLYVGQALVKKGDKDAAILAFDKALRMNFDPAVQEAAYYNYAVTRFDGATIPFGSSVATFEEFLRRYPDSRYAPDVQEYIVTGYMTDHNYESALESINRMRRPSDKVMAAKQQVLYNLGASALASDNARTARVYLDEADGLARYNSSLAGEVKLLLSEALYKTGEYKAAEQAANAFLRSARRDNANLSLGSYDLGYALFAQKDYDNAAKAFEKVTKTPGRLSKAVVADAYNRIGDAAYYRSDFGDAAAAYDRAYETNPASGDYALFQKAVMKGYARDHKGKIADLRRLPAEFPQSTLLADAMLEMTASYIQLGDNRSAIETYRRLVSEYPNTAQGRQGYLELALTLLNNKQRAEAIDSYRDIIRLYPTSDEAREAAEQLKRISAEDGTLDDYVAFINSVPGAPRTDVSEVDRLAFEAAEKIWLNDNSAARLQRYLEQHPDGAYRPQAYAYLLDDATSRGAKADALGYATRLVNEYPDNGLSENAYVVKAEAEYAEGKTEPAIATWRALEQRASSSKNLNRARAGIMRASRDLGDFESVARAAEALLASSTLGSEDKNEAVFSHALALDARGESAKAREEWATIASNTDDLYGAKSAYYRAQSLYDAGDRDEARRAVEALTASGTPHAYWLARGFILMSDIYAADGKDFEAREYLNALRENYPGIDSDIFMMIDNRLKK